jgi:hypothetical protein
LLQAETEDEVEGKARRVFVEALKNVFGPGGDKEEEPDHPIQC